MILLLTFSFVSCILFHVPCVTFDFVNAPSLAVFGRAFDFNGDLSKWDTSSTTDMEDSESTKT